MVSSIIDTKAKKSKEDQRYFEIGPDEMWTPFLENINVLMGEEKK